MKCFYHSADLDGRCSAAIIYQHDPFVELFAIDYGDPFPWDSIKPGERVYMVDFSLQPFSDMIRLNELADLVWIEHHKTAIIQAAQSGVVFSGLQRSGLGACALVWEKLIGSAVPRGVQLLAEYDVWDHHDPDCLPWQYGVRAEPNGPKEEVWKVVLGDWCTPYWDQVRYKGKIIYDWIQQDNAGKAKALAFPLELDGLKLLAANHGPNSSQFFDSLNPGDYDAVCLFYWKPRIKQWVVRLYSNKNGVDVSRVAQKYGGGGHSFAAGFQVAQLPFSL